MSDSNILARPDQGSDARPRAFDDLEDIPMGLSGETRRAVIKALEPVLADHLALYLLYKTRHWTVAGPLFRELHLLLDDHARSVLAAVDPVAERIVTLGGAPVVGPARLAERAGVREAQSGALAPRAMIEALIAANEVLIGRLRRAVSIADGHGYPGTSDLLTGSILREREREAWLLSAHLREGRLEG
jgi:starvation-inducible DNA-binding protein